jgi:hypothetical protein
VVITHQLKVALREDCHVVVDRSVFEVIDEPADDLGAARPLDEIASGNRLTRFVSERKKAVADALMVPDSHHVRARPRSLHKDENDQPRANPCSARRQRSWRALRPGP